MALKEWYVQDTYFEIANEYLLKHKKSPNAAVMRELCGGNGSLSTHQKLIERWKQTQHVELIELPEKTEKLIINKAKELSAEVWKALEEASHDENLRIQQEANEAIQIAQDSLSQVMRQNEALLSRLEDFNSRLESANVQNQTLIDKVNETEKLRFAAEDARRLLIDMLNELKESFRLEKIELENRFEVRLQELKEQLVTNETKHKEELTRIEEQREGNKKEYEGKLAAQEILKEELNSKIALATSDVNFYQSKYQQSIRDLEQRGEEIFHLKNEKQKLSHHLDENKTLRIKQAGQIDQLEKQLNEVREKNASLEYALRMQNTRVRELEENLNSLSEKISQHTSQEAN